ncbi:MAG: NAD(P)/FAD-dependent oxidoreductase [Spirochaetes bacterium]|nr:NAD(P)/FAD-dependent oxidoreductase [Spirochaetota bacterium]
MKYFYIIDNIKVDPADSVFDFRKYVLDTYRAEIDSYRIDKKAIDARKKNDIKIVYRIIIEMSVPLKNDGNYKNILAYDIPEPDKPVAEKRKGRILIVGAGPAGLFSALRLIEHGFKVCLIERGKPVEERASDISEMGRSGVLNTESNVLFGEGGAGTWSDGKLTTRINKPGIEWFFSRMVEFGAGEEILYDSKPHVGSDRLAFIVKNIRNYILESGSEIHFKEKVTEFILGKDEILGVKTAGGGVFTGDSVILAAGHSARDMYEYLNGINVTMETKPFAAGCRVEHPREFINKAQYGRFAEVLPAADYRLVHNNRESGRGVFSFCMCPGGVVINSSSEPEMLCVNGMSYSDRNLKNSNSAVVVTVKKEDMETAPLSGIGFQRQIEKAAYDISSGSYYAPACDLASFTGMKKSSFRISESSYQPGVYASDFRSILPGWMINEIRQALLIFDRKIPGFIENGILVGVETRTSSPVRILRNENCESLSLKRLYSAGEGAGYAGGIVSSAVDGIKIADIIASEG